MTAVEQLNSALTGRYKIEREIGAGGMATVYLARDVKHNRRVALKVLKPELGAVLGVERFLAEIQVTANLQHPNLLPLFDSGEAEGLLFYVMPFVEGESLRARLDREKQLPVDDAVRIAVAVASALDYAHAHGVIHRDLKPENILMQAGQPVIADFGIALAVTKAGGARITQTGLSLGTPQYMSPEQAAGDRELDGRSDIYSLGAITYEMLAGEPPHSGTSAQAIIAKLLTSEPQPLRTLRATVPVNMACAVEQALAKLPADRFESAQEFADALGNPAYTNAAITGAASTPARTRRRQMREAGIALAGAAAVLLATTLAAWWRSAPPQRVERFEFPILLVQRLLAANAKSVGFSLSRDGSRIVYGGRSASGVDQVWVRDLADLRSRPIPGTEGSFEAAISPDGESVAFIAGGALKTISMRGDNPATLVPSDVAAPTWASDGMIYFAARSNLGSESGVLGRVPEHGGRIDTIAKLPGRYFSQVSPLPGGHALLACVSNFAHAVGVIVTIALPAGAMHELFRGCHAEYSDTGHLLYVTEDGVLMAAPFDPTRVAVTGPSVALSESGPAAPVVSGLSLSKTGMMLYAVGLNRSAELAWVTREGVAQSLDTATHGRVSFPALSPDGARLAFNWDDALWIRDMARGTSSRLTSDFSNYPAWTSDGQSVSYFWDDSASYRLWIMRADGSTKAKALMPDRTNVVESLWTPDGKSLLFRTGVNSPGAGDVYLARASADTTPTLILNSKFTEAAPALSPDGKWLAFNSDESGRYEVYVVPFPHTGAARWNVSTRGGTEPAWSHSGNELFYRDGAGNMVSVDVRMTPSFSLGASKVLFSASGYASYDRHQEYAVARDDKRFLMVRLFGSEQAPRLVLVKNWVTDLKAKSAAK